MSPRQLLLDLGHRTALGRDDFLISPSNADAATWIDRWPSWPEPGRGLALVGPEGSGKSHLAAVWRARSAAAHVVAPELSVDAVPSVLASAQHAVIERFDAGCDEQAVLHLYNTVAERRGSVLILSRRAPARLGLRLPDLASRLSTLPIASIGLPDESLLAGVLAKHFADRQVAVRDDVVAYMVARMERSFAAAERLARRLDEASLESRGAISTALVRRMLEEETGEPDAPGPVNEGE